MEKQLKARFQTTEVTWHKGNFVAVTVFDKFVYILYLTVNLHISLDYCLSAISESKIFIPSSLDVK